jgi:hypothetical protein
MKMMKKYFLRLAFFKFKNSMNY